MINKKKIIEKIQKLLAKKNSNFAAEAENAILKAQKLMLENDIHSGEIETDDLQQGEEFVNEAVQQQARPPLWYAAIGKIIGDNFKCSIYWERNSNSGHKKLHFFGLKSDVEIAKEVYLYAIALIKYNIRGLKKTNPHIGTPYINTYINGFVHGLAAKLKFQVKEYGVIIVKDDTVIQYEKDLHSRSDFKFTKDKRKVSNNAEFFDKGYKDGQSFDYNKKRIGRE